MLDYLKDRPLVTTRFPDGISEKGFYEKDAPKGTPSWVETYRKYSNTVKRNRDYIVCNDLDTLLWLANLAALEIHIPLSRIDSYWTRFFAGQHYASLIFWDVKEPVFEP